MSKYTIIVAVIAGLVLALAPAPASATITEVVEPAGGYPEEGYRLVFPTSTTTDATNTGITYYNDFVNNLANDVGSSGSIVADLNATWKCLGSTENTSAKKNTKTYISTDPEYDSNYDLKIYSLNGYLIAEGNQQLWSGGYDSHAGSLATEQGTGGEYNIWTGTGTDGVPSGGQSWFGDTDGVQWGFIYSQGYGWFNKGTDAASSQRKLLALSDPIPEPATLALLVIGAPLLALRRRRRRLP